jgi:hypothetical protein
MPVTPPWKVRFCLSQNDLKPEISTPSRRIIPTGEPLYVASL